MLLTHLLQNLRWFPTNTHQRSNFNQILKLVSNAYPQRQKLRFAPENHDRNIKTMKSIKNKQIIYHLHNIKQNKTDPLLKENTNNISLWKSRLIRDIIPMFV